MKIYTCSPPETTLGWPWTRRLHGNAGWLHGFSRNFRLIFFGRAGWEKKENFWVGGGHGLGAHGHHENQWKHMKISGNIWKSMETYENQWKHMEINGNVWKSMETYENQWKHIDVNDSMIWKSMQTYENQWKHMKINGNIWEIKWKYVKTNGSICKSMENIWKSMKIHKNQWKHNMRINENI